MNIDPADPTAEGLALKIADLTVAAEVRPDIVFSALMNALVFWMSCICPNCRRDFARKLADEIPTMLESADHHAQSPSTPTCH
jgi:hypothetical protein